MNHYIVIRGILYTVYTHLYVDRITRLFVHNDSMAIKYLHVSSNQSIDQLHSVNGNRCIYVVCSCILVIPVILMDE